MVNNPANVLCVFVDLPSLLNLQLSELVKRRLQGNKSVPEPRFNAWSSGVPSLRRMVTMKGADCLLEVVRVRSKRHDFSLSVGGAPDGAGAGTSESTEGDQTPVVPEIKMPSAVAAAEGDETKHSNGK